MSVDPELLELFVDTVGIRPPTTQDFDGAQQAHGAAVNHKAHVSATTRELTRSSGEVLVSQAKVTFTERLAIDPKSLLVMPARFQIGEAPVLMVSESTDEIGPHHSIAFV